MKFTASDLEHFRLNAQAWSGLMADNAQRLEDTLLKISGMLDVSLTSLADKDTLRYNASTQKFENVPFYDVFSSTTTSSTTTTTSSSSSTTTAP